MALRTLFLDFGNTLVAERPSRFELYASEARAGGVPIDENAMRELMTRAHAELPAVINGAYRYTDEWFEAYIERIFASSPTVTNCTFSGNSATSLGGGMFNLNNSSPTVSNCTFSGDSADVGGGMWNDNSSPTVSNCTFSGNSADAGGGMFNIDGSNPTVTNCTFSGNSAIGGGGMWNDNSSPTVSNTGFCDNTRDQINGGFTDGGGNSLLYCAPPIPKPNPCPTDINDDGVTNVLDLIQLLLQFGQACP